MVNDHRTDAFPKPQTSMIPKTCALWLQQFLKGKEKNTEKGHYLMVIV